MGKTSLIHRVLEYGRVHNHKTVYLDFNNIERSILQDWDKLLRWLCATISRQLELPNQLESYWNKNCLGNSDSCTAYFESYILGKSNYNIVFGFDNIDRLFACTAIIEDLLKMLNNWHFKSKIDRHWSRLKLILAHSTEVYIPSNADLSLFDAGVPILLEEFNYQEVAELASIHKLNWKRSQIEQLMDLVGGYPYLIRLAMYQIKNQQLSLEQFLDRALDERGIYCGHLLCLADVLHQSPKLNLAFTKVINSAVPVKLNFVELYQLHSIGLVKHQFSSAYLRCKLYRHYFNQLYVAKSIS